MDPPPSFHSMNKLWGVPNLNYKTFNHILGNYEAAMNIRMNIQEPPSLKIETKIYEVNNPQDWKKKPKTLRSNCQINQYCCVYFTPITIPGSLSNVTLSNLHFSALFLSGVVSLENSLQSNKEKNIHYEFATASVVSIKQYGSCHLIVIGSHYSSSHHNNHSIFLASSLFLYNPASGQDQQNQAFVG